MKIDSLLIDHLNRREFLLCLERLVAARMSRFAEAGVLISYKAIIFIIRVIRRVYMKAREFFYSIQFHLI